MKGTLNQMLGRIPGVKKSYCRRAQSVQYNFPEPVYQMGQMMLVTCNSPSFKNALAPWRATDPQDIPMVLLTAPERRSDELLRYALRKWMELQ